MDLKSLGFLSLLIAPVLVACAIQDGSHDDHGDPDNNPSTPPLTVVVDANQTMSQTGGGDGIGVFVTYSTGGHWRVWWTCDTHYSNLSCNFDLGITGTSIANAKSVLFEDTDSLDTSDATGASIGATTLTTTGFDEVDFDTAPGTTIEINASVAGVPNTGDFFFFVQDGAIDGNYPGHLTNPLIFEPSSP